MSNSPIVPLSTNVRQSIDALIRKSNAERGRDVQSRGVFSALPLMSPKYARHTAADRNDREETMARMFIQVNPSDYKAFLASIADSETRKIAQALTGDNVKQGGIGYCDFLLQRADHSMVEKMQIVDTLSDNYVAFFFGQAPAIWSYSGMLYNTYQDDWTMRMMRIYRELARGTQLAKHGCVVSLRYDSLVVSGAITSFNFSMTAESPLACAFNFTLLVKSAIVMYGGYAPPTRIPDDNQFVPVSVNLNNSLAGSGAAKAYVGSVPSGVQPAGVSEQTIMHVKEDWESVLDELDAQQTSLNDSGSYASTGTTYTEPITEKEVDFYDSSGSSDLQTQLPSSTRN